MTGELKEELKRILQNLGFTVDRAELCARIFAENTRDGVQSHGVHRFPMFVESVRRGLVDPHAAPRKLGESGSMEHWDGLRGPGILNALFCMEHAVEIARKEGIGLVSLRNTNHWMRAGTYGLLAADAGCIGLCWTNTMALMPPWGSLEPRLGNNPLVVCIPRKGGHVLLDMAMSQFSYGRMSLMARSGRKLPVPGGFTARGDLTHDPEEILQGTRALPVGYWKGSGLALVLDCLAAILSSGQATFQVGKGKDETGLSQVFIAIDAGGGGSDDRKNLLLEQILEDFRSAKAIHPGEPVTFPGERMMQQRRESERKGIDIDDAILDEIRAL